MDIISVGVLLPNSTILPMSKLFDRGMKSVFKAQSDIEIELYPEFIGQGSLKQVDDAISKLMNFDDVDVITGLVSSKVVMEVAEKVRDKELLFLPNNLGEQLLNPEKLPENILLNSPLLWQQHWSLGHWAVKEFGKKGMFVGGVYDMAYCFTQMLDLGMKSADPDCEWSFAVSHVPEEGTFSDPEVVFEYIEKEMPDFLFAAFCGNEATAFLDGFIARGLHKKMPLIATPYLLQNFSQSVDEPLTIYTTLAAGKPLANENLSEEWTTQKGIFSTLGKESARIILEGARAGGVDRVKDLSFETDRGLLNILPSMAGTGQHVVIVENKYQGDMASVDRKIIGEVPIADINDEAIRAGLQQLETSWQNPYLAV